MAAEIEDRGGAQVHWLVAGQFGLGDRGKTLTLTRADFNEVLQKASLSVQATIPDAVGAGESRAVTLQVDSLKKLTLKHVVGAVPELTELAAKAEQIGKIKDPTVAGLEDIVGPGRLLDAMKAIVSPDEAPAGGAGGGDASGDTKKIFEKAEVQKPTAKSAVSAFIKATSTSSKKKGKSTSRQLRDLMEEVVWGMAADVLGSPEVRAMETAWRGLRFLVTQCPKDAGMAVVLLETEPENALDELGKRERADDIDEPECIFIPHEFASTEPLGELADFAEQELIPIVAGVAPSVFGAADSQGIPAAFDALEHARNEEDPEWVETWNTLRARPSSRWLCAVANRVALHAEGSGVAQRTVFGPGVWAVASMLAKSFAGTGGFARIFGKAGSVNAPATHTIAKGQYADTACPTEGFYPIAATEMVAKNGILGLSSARNSDAVVLSKAPCASNASGVIPLPAQILTGRIVRFATWVKPQLPEGCNSATANDIYMAAASVFLFPGNEEAAHVRAAVTNIEGEAHVVVHSRANPAIASVPFDIGFPLPLGWSVPAPEDDGESAVAAPSAGSAAEVKPEAKGDKGDGVGLAGSSVGFDVGIDKKD